MVADVCGRLLTYAAHYGILHNSHGAARHSAPESNYGDFRRIESFGCLELVGLEFGKPSNRHHSHIFWAEKCEYDTFDWQCHPFVFPRPNTPFPGFRCNRHWTKKQKHIVDGRLPCFPRTKPPTCETHRSLESSTHSKHI